MVADENVNSLKKSLQSFETSKFPSYKLSCLTEALFAFFAVTLKSAPMESTETFILIIF